MPFLLMVVLSVTIPACSKKVVLEAASVPPDVPEHRHHAAGPPPGAEPPRRVTPPPPLPEMECAGRVVLTEVQPDPKRSSDRSGEYVEVYNPGDTAVHLNGWRLTDLERDSHVISSEPPVTVEPHGFLVLGSNADLQANGGVPVDYVYADFHLSNEADRVVLENPCGDPVVDVRYPTARGWPKHKAGRAIELTSPPGEAAVWRLATHRLPSGDFGSPGAASWASVKPHPSPKGTPVRPGGG